MERESLCSFCTRLARAGRAVKLCLTGQLLTKRSFSKYFLRFSLVAKALRFWHDPFSGPRNPQPVLSTDAAFESPHS